LHGREAIGFEALVIGDDLGAAEGGDSGFSDQHFEERAERESLAGLDGLEVGAQVGAGEAAGRAIVGLFVEEGVDAGERRGSDKIEQAEEKLLP